MPALKTIVLTLKNKEKIIIPIVSSNGRGFNFNGISANNEVETIRLELDRNADKVYEVVKSKQSIYRQEVSKKAFDGYVKKVNRKKTRD